MLLKILAVNRFPQDNARTWQDNSLYASSQLLRGMWRAPDTQRLAWMAAPLAM
jgi:hypothetical protein